MSYGKFMLQDAKCQDVLLDFDKFQATAYCIYAMFVIRYVIKIMAISVVSGGLIMINEKMAKMAGSNSAVRAMFEEGNRLKALYGPENVYDFSIGKPYFPAPASVKTAIVEILETLDSNYIHGYMSNDGYPEVRQTVAEYINKNFGDNISGDHIIMTVGAGSALNVLLRTMLNPEEEVIGRDSHRRLAADIDAVLSDFEKHVLTLYLEGLPYRDMAQRLDRPVKSVENAVTRIRQKLSHFRQ